MLHCNKLSSEYRTFHSGLSLQEPSDQGIIHVDQVSGAQSSSPLLTGMVTIHEGSKVDRSTSSFWSIRRFGFRDITVKVFPLSAIVKLADVYVRRCGVKGQAAVMLSTQV